MLKYSIIGFWEGFNLYYNEFTIKYCKNYFLTFNYEEIDFIICGSFIKKDQYNLIKNLKCKKILYITEPIEKFYEFTYKLYIENEFIIIFGCIDNDIINNKYKYPIYSQKINLLNKNIFNNINIFSKNVDINKKKFCCLINTHDRGNTRSSIYNILNDIDRIDCPSILFNNCSNDELNSIGNIEYIKNYKFNICSENFKTNIDGYITEKIINCCMGEAIPIYYGWFDKIDEKIFNKNRILFYDPLNEESINNVKTKILYLLNNEEEFNNFYKQDIFCENAYEIIIELENNLFNMFNNL